MSSSSYRLGGGDADRRLDRLLRKLLPDVPLSALYRAIRTGAITVNHKRATPQLRTRPGDLLIVDMSTVPTAAPHTDQFGQTPLSAPHPHRALRVLLETDDTVVVHKPAGLSMNGGSDSVVARLRNLVGAAPSLSFHPSPTHQLDKITSGALVVARTLASARAWSQRFATRAVEKRYLAVVEGTCAAGQWRDRVRFDGRRGVAARSDQHDASARDAALRCVPLAYGQCDGEHLTLVLIHLETGRRHQIRAQAAWRGHAVRGDERYGSRARQRPFLHAWQLQCDQLLVTATAPPSRGQMRALMASIPNVATVLRRAGGRGR